MSQEITAQELTEIRLCHQSDEWANEPCCHACRAPWPCDTAQVLAYFDFLTPLNLTRVLAELEQNTTVDEQQIAIASVERVLADLDRQLNAAGVGALDRQGVFHKIDCRCLDGQTCAIALDEPWPQPKSR